MSIPTRAQAWARKRNFCKFVIKGMVSSIYSLRKLGVLTMYENTYLNRLEIYLSSILNRWDEETPKSRENYLNQATKHDR